MNTEISQKETLLYRTLLALALIALAAALRMAPHPWNFTPVGAMALFSGAVLKDRRLAFIFPLVALFAGDVFIGFHKLLPIVYASFLVNVAIGLWLRDRRTVARITLATLLGAIQFFIVTNFAVWQFLSGFPHTASGLAACYIAGIPFFWNTLAGDAVYAALLFGGYALGRSAEHQRLPRVSRLARNSPRPEQTRRRNGHARLAGAELHGPRAFALRPQKLFLPGPAQGLPNLAIRIAARYRRLA